jgi:hypothetical protein
MLSACASPAHLQPDFGDCYTAAFSAQADLDRPTAVDLDTPLSGEEALAIRARAAEATSDEADVIPLVIGKAKR